jgi:hypothetical protein
MAESLDTCILDTQCSLSRPCGLHPLVEGLEKRQRFDETIAVSYLPLPLILRPPIAFRLTLLAIGTLRNFVNIPCFV